MTTQAIPQEQITFACETCMTRARSEANPNSLVARLWRWHTGWCPAWKAYQDYLATQKQDPKQV